jgi:putative phosphoribosyl transferase
VLGLPRGGVPVAFEVAQALGAPLDVLVVRKLGVPVQPELAMGAVGEDGVRVLNDDVLRMVRLRPDQLAAVERTERAEVQRRLALFRGGRARERVAGRVAVVVDDGIATGSTARAACQVARAHGARRVIVAVPVGSAGTLRELSDVADDVVCLLTPATFFAIGEFYDDFSQTTDAEVVALLQRSAADRAAADHTPDSAADRVRGEAG